MNVLRPFAALSLSLLLLCAGFASCSKDADSSARGERLPEGRYPIEFTAGGVEIEPFTRATVDGDWDGVQNVAVWLYTRPGFEVKRYSVTSADGGKTAKFTSDDPFWWEFNGESEGVMAWYPYSDSYPSAWTVKADQSAVENYRASDLVMGRNADLSFAGRNDPSKNKITFVHQTSKIVVNLVAGPGVTLDGNTSVKFLNVSGVETGNTVTAYRPDAAKQSFHALLSPQKIAAGTPLIQVNAAGKEFVYTPSAERQLNPNASYTYTITVKAAGIEVKEAMGGEWTDGGSEDVASISIIHYTAADLKIGDYYYSDGTWSDGGLRKLYSDGTMTMENPKPAPVSGKTVIGIVFHVGQHPNDQSDYSGSGIGQKNCQGYAVALTDATTGYCVWGEYGTKLNLYIDGNYSNLDIDWSGYAGTHKIINAAGGKGGLNDSEQSGYPAIYYVVVAYEDDCPAPTNSSGWFLPSIGQMLKVYQQRNLLTYVDGSSLKDDDYWSSSEDYEEPEYYAIFMNVDNGFVYGGIKNDYYCYVRAILAF